MCIRQLMQKRGLNQIIIWLKEEKHLQNVRTKGYSQLVIWNIKTKDLRIKPAHILNQTWGNFGIHTCNVIVNTVWTIPNSYNFCYCVQRFKPPQHMKIIERLEDCSMKLSNKLYHSHATVWHFQSICNTQ